MQEKFQEFPGGSSGPGRSSGEENGYPLQYSCLGKPLDREAWKTTVYGIAKELDTTQGLNNNNYIMSRRRAEILFIYLPFCNFIYFVCIFGCAGSLLLHSGFLQLWWAGSSCGFSCCGAQILEDLGFSGRGTRAQQLQFLDFRAQVRQVWHTSLVVLPHTGSFQTREPMSPTLVDRFVTTEPPEKPMEILSYSYLFPNDQYLFLPSSKH